MHDCLRDLGREMANGLSCPRRLWCSHDLKHLETKGFRNILAETKSRCFHSFIDNTMNCRVTFFLGGSDSSDCTTNFLWWLQLEYYGYRTNPSFPSWIPLQNLRCLIIRNMWVKSLWHSNEQASSQSKELKIHNSYLVDFPGGSGMSSSLENKISDLDGLLELNISVCQDLHELSVGHFSCLEKLILNNCYSLKTVSGIFELRNLVVLDISKCPLIGQMSLVSLNSLKHFKVDDSLKWTFFEVRDCSNLQTMSGIQHLGKLASINIRDCRELEVLPSLQGIRSLKTITIDGCGKLKNIFLSQCQNLERVTVRMGLICLEEIDIHECGKLTCFQSFDCPNLKQVSISDCSAIEELPCFACQTHLDNIRIVRCEKLRNITLPKNLVELGIQGCRELKTVRSSCLHTHSKFQQPGRLELGKPYHKQGIDELHGLETMQLSYCRNPTIWDCVSMFKVLI